MTDTEEMVVDERPGDGSGRETGHGRPLTLSSGQAAATKSNAPSLRHVDTVEIQSTTILKVLGCCILIVVTLHFLVMTLRFGFGYNYLKGFVPLFNLEAEKNVPTLFSSLQLFIAAILLGICAAQHKLIQGEYFRNWAGLSAIFVFLAFDESASIHEKTLSITRELFGTSGLLYYSWIIPFGVFAVIVLLANFRFLLALPSRIGLIFFLSGAVFVTGAIGMEMFEGQINEAGGYRSFDYMILVTIEEILEIIGIYGFIYGLLSHLTAEGRPLKLSLVR